MNVILGSSRLELKGISMFLNSRLMVTVFLFLANRYLAWGQVDVSSDLETIRLSRNMPGLMAMVVKQGRVLAQGAAGYRRVGSVAPLLVSDPVNLGSCTKWMTATITGRLVDRGIIGWNTRVGDLFTNYPAFNAAFTNATLDQILCHRAGIQQENTFDTNHWSTFLGQFGTVPQLRRWVADTVLKDAPEVTPGTYLYANQGYIVAATMMEIASGKDWETLVQDEIFTPIRMQSAKLGQVFDNVVPPKAPVGHDLGVGTNLVPRSTLPNNYEFHYKASAGPAGYVSCTLQDWVKFLHIQATSGISDFLSPATGTRLQQAYTGAGTEGYGRGIITYNRSWALPGQALAHGGDIFGEDSLVWMAPALDFIVVAFANCSAANSATSLALNDVATLLVGRYSASAASGPLLETPKIVSLAAEGNVALGCQTLPGVSYVVEVSTNLMGGWTPVNGISGQPATKLVSVYSMTNNAMTVFYRTKVP